MSEKGREQERPPLLFRCSEREREREETRIQSGTTFFRTVVATVVARGRRPWTISEWDLPFDFLFLQHLVFLTEWIGNNTQGQ